MTLGVAIPLLMLDHLKGTRVAFELYSQTDSYTRWCGRTAASGRTSCCAAAPGIRATARCSHADRTRVASAVIVGPQSIEEPRW